MMRDRISKLLGSSALNTAGKAARKATNLRELLKSYLRCHFCVKNQLKMLIYYV